MTEVEPRLK